MAHPNLQEPLIRLLGSQRRKQSRLSKQRPPNPQHPTWWFPPIDTPTHSRKSLISSITFHYKNVWSCLVGSSSQSSISPHPHSGIPHAGCPETRYSVHGRIWKQALGGQNGVNSCASSAGMRTMCVAGSSNWSILSTRTVSKFVS